MLKPIILLLLLSGVVEAQQFSVKAGATTNGTLEAYREALEQRQHRETMDPASAAFMALNVDTLIADSFIRVDFRALKDDEVACGEMWFGMAWVCRTQNRHEAVGSVLTQPLPVVYKHWLEEFSADFLEFKRISAGNTGKGLKFAADLEAAYREPDAVWSKETLIKFFQCVSPVC